jgi:hypothetical protein
VPEKLGYKRVETDTEFVARIQKKYKWWTPFYTGAGLDKQAWDDFDMQRRIIEVYP